MQNTVVGEIIKITGAKVVARVTEAYLVEKVSVNGFVSNYISIGSLVGTDLVDGRTLVMTIEEINESNDSISFTTSISGIYDAVTKKIAFGTNSYPLINEKIYKLDGNILSEIFSFGQKDTQSFIGTYIYDTNVKVGYEPNVLFGKHLGIFGNTGSGKTCTAVSVIQNYIRLNTNKDIKFIILDVNGEYRTAFNEDEAEYVLFDELRFHHSSLSNTEYGRLFRASEGVQYPALKECIADLSANEEKWDLEELTDRVNQWVIDNSSEDKYGNKETFSKNQISGYLRTMNLRIDGIVNESDLMQVINSKNDEDTLNKILSSEKKVIILDLQVSSDSLDIVLYLFFKAIYEYKSKKRDSTHIALVLEEAHRYINKNVDETKLGSYYIDKLSREGRKFGIGLIIASQVPSMLNYEIVSQCNSVIMHKITSKRDLEFLKGVLRVSNDTFYLQMSSLEKQYAIVCGEAFPNDSVVKIFDAKPLPMSNDPVISTVEQK